MANDSFLAIENGSHAKRVPVTMPEFEIRVLLRKLRRRKWLFLATVVLVTAGTGVFVFTATPKYTAEALLTVEAGGPRIAQIEAAAQGLADDTRVLETQAAILRSDGLAAKVIDRLNLRDDPELNPALPNSGQAGRLRAAIEPLSTWFRAGLAWLSQNSSQTPAISAASLDSVITRFRSLLTVSPRERSSIIAVQFSSRDPEKAAFIANAVVETFVHERAESKRVEARSASLMFNDRVRELRNRVAAADSAVQLYRQQHHLTTFRGITTTDQQMSELNTQLVLAQAEEARALARLRQARELPQDPEASEVSSDVLGSPLIQHLREQEALLIQTAAQLSSEYGSKHPKMLQIKAQLRDLRRQIKTEIDKIVRSLASDLEVARARRASLQSQIQILTQQSAANGEADVKLQELEREAKAVQTLYTTLLSRAEEATAQEYLQEESLLSAHMVSPALVPHTPTFPRPIPMLAAGFAGSLLIGMALVSLREKLDRGVRGKSEIEWLTGMRVLALVPRLAKRLARNTHSRTAYPASWTSAPDFHEAMRRLHTAISSQQRENGAGKILLVTSSIPEEGKSFLCAALGLQLARSGIRCALVDCDFRRSGLANILGAKNLPGLAHLVAGRMELSEVIHSVGDLHFVPSGMSGLVDAREIQRISGLLPSVFGSEVMESFLRTLAMRYDVIIIDAPPMIVSDSLVLSRLANGTIFVVRWGRTRHDEMVAGLKQLTEHGAHVEGIVLTQVDARKYMKYGYTDLELSVQVYRKYSATSHDVFRGADRSGERLS